MDVFRTIFPEEFLATFLEHQVRPDGRAIDQVRKTAITTGTPTPAPNAQLDPDRAVVIVSVGHVDTVDGDDARAATRIDHDGVRLGDGEARRHEHHRRRASAARALQGPLARRRPRRR